MIQCFCGMVHDAGRLGFRGALLAAAEASSSSPASAGPADPALIEDLVAANHILCDQGVVDGFGHVSARHDKNPNRYLLARSMAPALVTEDDIMEFDLDSTPVDQQGRRLYLERFIHGEIYKARPDVHAVVHSHSPAVIPYANTRVQLAPMNHISGFLGGGVPVFEIRDAGGATNMLVGSGDLAKALAAKLADKPVVLIRGHGNVVVGPSVKRATIRAVYTEVNARLQTTALGLGGAITYISPEEGALRDKAPGEEGRAWDGWKAKALRK